MENGVKDKSKKFAVRIIRFCQYLNGEKREYVMSRQILRSGTSIGANIREASEGQSKADFISKMSIALKEASETEYWLELLYETEYMSAEQYESMRTDCNELVKMLTSIVKTSRQNHN